MVSPRGRQFIASQGRANISYEPPNDILSTARLVAGPCGKPTYTLPPVHAGTPASWRNQALAVPRSGFTDDPPPEPGRGIYSNATDTVATAPSMGPAPWLKELSPMKRSPHRHANAPGHFASTLQGQPPAANYYAGPAYACGPGCAPAPGTPSARQRARGNVRSAAEADQFGTPMAAPEGLTYAAGPDGGVELHGGGYCANALAPVAAATASETPLAERPTVSFAPKPKTVEPVVKEPNAKEKAKAAAKEKAAAKAKTPVAELALAERARERVRERREQRARSEQAKQAAP